MNRQTSAVNPHPLQRARQAQGLSRETLAGAAHITVRALERIEGGEVKNPHQSTRQLLAGALGVEIEVIFPDGREREAA